MENNFPATLAQEISVITIFTPEEITPVIEYVKMASGIKDDKNEKIRSICIEIARLAQDSCITLFAATIRVIHCENKK